MAEWGRVFKRKSMMLAVVLLLAANFVLFLHHTGISFFDGFAGMKQQFQQERRIQRETEALYDRYSGKSASEILELLDGEELDAAGLNVWFQYHAIAAYQPGLEKVQQNAEEMLKGIAASDRDSFYARNIRKTAEDYGRIEDVELTAGYNTPFQYLSTYNQSEYLTFVFLLILVLFFLEERRKGLWNLIYAAPKGRNRLAAHRAAILAAAACFMIALLWVENLLVASAVFGGLGDFSRSIQSVPGFHAVTMHLSVRSFFLLTAAGKAVTLMAVGLLVWVFVAYPRMPVFGAGAVILFFGAEYAAWTWIPKFSSMAFLKYINLFSYLDMNTLMSDYFNLNFFGIPVNKAVTFPAFMPWVLLLLIFATVRAGKIPPVSGKRSVFRKISDRIGGYSRKKEKSRFRPVPVLHETYKQMIVQGGLLVLLVLVFFSVRSMDLHNIYYSYAMQMYLDYMDVLEGPYLPEKQAYLEQEKETLEGKLEEALQMYGPDSEQYKELSSADEMLADLITLSGRYARWTEDGVKVEYVSGIGYDKLYGEGSSQTEKKQALIITVFLILLSGGLFAYERQQGAAGYLETMKYGRGRLRLRKYILTAESALFVCLVVYGCRFYEIYANYGLDGFLLPVQSVPLFIDIPLRIPVVGFLALMYVADYLAALSVGFLILYLSEHSAGILQAMIKAMMILALPAGIAYMGAEALDSFTVFAPFCLFNRLRACGGWKVSVFAGLFCVMAAAFASVLWQNRRNVRRTEA